jgi:hypothetical protein
MEEYISRVKRLSTTDSLNAESVNSVVQQLAHNIDILYNSIALSNKNWNVSELVFGNMLDINSTGEKVFVNGGRMDSVEKVLSFKASLGTISYENNSELVNVANDVEGEHFLRWDLPEGVSENVVLTRNIAVPEQLRHQNIILGFKLCGYIFNEAITDEKFDIYVNGVYVGSGETDVVEMDGLNKMKTIYGTYSLSGSERNLEVKLVRSSIQTTTQDDYRVRIQDVFIGLNSLALDQYYLNFPTSNSIDTDISGFYDFDNNSIVPVPKIWTNVNAVSTTASINVTVNPIVLDHQDEYWIAKESAGNGLGTTEDNKMSASDFFSIESFKTSNLTIHLDCSESYGDFTFDKGLTYNIEMICGDVFCGDITVSNGSVVDLVSDLSVESTSIVLLCTSLTVDNKSRFSAKMLDSSNRFEVYCNGNLNILGQSSVYIECGMFGMPLDQGVLTTVHDHSHLSLKLGDSSYQNNDSRYGIGCVIVPLNVNKYSFVEVISANELLSCHLANSKIQDKPVLLKNHSQLIINGFALLNTYSNDRTFYAFLHSSIEIKSVIDFSRGTNCDTSFQKIEVGLFSSFGALSIPDDVERELVESFVYELD